jgi:acetyl esterase/lipase
MLQPKFMFASLVMSVTSGITFAALAAKPVAKDPPPIIMKLWPGNPPGFVEGVGPEKVTDQWGSIGNVNIPGIAVHLPPAQERTGLAFLVCPGGGYTVVGNYTDGARKVPEFLPKGVVVIVLKYRTRPPSKDVHADSLADAQRAMRLVRYHAKEWGIDPHRIGALGGSAGANLILNLATHWDEGNKDSPDPIERESCRPDFVGMLCPWPDKQSVSDFPIKKEDPPAFACSARDDVVAPTAFAAGIVDAYHRVGARARLWTVAEGGHRAFDRVSGEGSKWPDHFIGWLKELRMWK